jgi:hypothetical protein
MVTRLTLAAIALTAGVGGADPLPIPTVSLLLKDDPVPPLEPRKRFFKLRSGTRLEPVVHIVPPPVGSAGDPTQAGATLTVYNGAGSGQVATVTLPAARWSLIGSSENFKGYRFHDDTPIDGPIVRVFVKPDKIFVAGGRANLDVPPRSHAAGAGRGAACAGRGRGMVRRGTGQGARSRLRHARPLRRHQGRHPAELSAAALTLLRARGAW